MRLAAARTAALAAARWPPRAAGRQGLTRGRGLCQHQRERPSSSSSSAARRPVAAAAAAAAGGPWSLYAQPALYDAVFGFRDFEEEIEFIASALATHGARPAFTSFLDVGCGPARHARAAAAAGVDRVVALDAAPAMLAAAAAAAAADGVTITTLEADMTRFELAEPVDAALIALGTLAHATAPAAPAATFACLAAALAPGGVAVIELGPAADTFDGCATAGDAWDVDASPATGGLPLVVEYGSPDDAFDPVTQLLERSVVVSVAGPDGSVEREVGRETVTQRIFTPGEIRALATGAGLTVAAEVGDLVVGAGGAAEGERYVAVLVKGV